MLGRVPVGARQQQAPLRMMGAGGPQLLTIHQPALAVAVSTGGCTGQIGTTARFAEQLTPTVFAAQNTAQKTQLVIIGAVFEQGRGRQQADADTRYADRPARFEFFFHHRQQGDRQVAAIPCARPMGHAPAGVSEQIAPRHEAALDVPVLLQPRAHFGAH